MGVIVGHGYGSGTGMDTFTLSIKLEEVPWLGTLLVEVLVFMDMTIPKVKEAIGMT
jgi:hypothetical protein